ncbi:MULTISPECIES: cation-translocating P-type ATPase [Streptomycetaceae]|uniref:Transport ATPase n=1 Tax=Streptantibioticus cattleyicolor (strain ATCC 35852 / DSM 46488 / JCM 4925 / NBRC 14057 / NRRL 8057) TaxID=1003195 RepID=F8JT04_STREN|nr:MULTISPECIES: cation-translocating P-type ATPase [Streptomycetaceae]AEW98102.1 transport ATPase [Streptantibioticus cattleyicolor NRRL 8057 = DSM 46488]MYS62493.1 HAD-IC family P-type ATPase [Streptomyces sp. SID5468]CCB78415.1 putative cation-transporting ATPase I [Streptantibioticus cattleyicolor NRRL 8057 = DSM 46488]
MVRGALAQLVGAGAGLALAAPVRIAGRVVPAAGAAARLAIDVAETGVRATADATATAVRAGRVARNALAPGSGVWRAGPRVHVPLRLGADGGDRRGRRLESAAKRVAAAVAEHPEVVSAYWDGGLARLVIQVTEAALTDRIAREASRLATRYGLERAAEQVPARRHPGAAEGVRTTALAMACDAAGITTALATRAVRLKNSPRLVTAVVTLIREDSRVRAALRRRLGPSGAELVLAAANAAAHGIGQSPASLVLDAALRGGHLVEALARGAAFDAWHDTLCAPRRPSVSGRHVARPALVRTPGQEYADQAVTGSLVGAAATLLLTRSADRTAEAVLAGSPKAARYAPAAFTAAWGTALAHHGVLVRDPERLRQLERVDALVIHPEVLHGTRRTVLRVDPTAAGWDHDRLWHAATAALRRSSPSGGSEGDPRVELRAVSGHTGDRTGSMIASAGGVDVGTVLVGWEIDPLADAVLDAARRARLHVVVPEDVSLADFTELADEVVPGDRPLSEVVGGLRERGRVVMTVVRVREDPDVIRGELTEHGRELVDGLLAGDVAVAVTDARGVVVWGADALVPTGLAGVWRVLSAVPDARAVGRRGKVLAQAGAALSGLMVMTGTSRARRAVFALGYRLSPVNAAAAAALVSGWYTGASLVSRAEPAARSRVPWHALRPKEVLARLAARDPGPPDRFAAVRAAVAAPAGRLARLPVFLPARMTARLAAAVRAELDDPLTPVLAVGAAASAVLGAPVDALLVTGAMGVNAVVGGVQRLRAERALAALTAGQRQRARRVEQDVADCPVTVDAAQLSPGEVIELRTGDVVPADARLLEVTDLEVDESSLTGESLPVAKELAAAPQAALADRRCMVFQGTSVVAGDARAVVVGTGDHTEAGRAAHLASRSTPAAGVQARLHELTRKILPLTLAGGAVVTGLSLLRGRPVREAVGGGVAVAVAAVPEGLPLVATVAQMAAARRLSRHGVLVRTPRALEALGRMDTICFDKTGTLTHNRLRVVRSVTADGTTHTTDAPESATVLRAAARACPPGNGETQLPHATEAAILADAPADPHWTHLDGRPFEASRGYACAVGRDADDELLLVVKGAPEVVLPYCENAGTAPRAAETLAGEGLRILAVAQRRLRREELADVLDQPLGALDLTGFVALADTPRADSTPLIAELRDAGVRPVMLTGDHPHTARAIAVTLGWPEDVTVATGEELAALDRAGRARLLADCGVIARVAPEQKLSVVEALQEAGRVVAMVGDGANDAAAIRAADIGIGIAARGSAAARRAADLVLTGDALTPLVAAVTEGRALWRSVADAIAILTGGNAGEVAFTVLGTLVSGTSPLSTRQLLLVNLLTDMFPAMAVAVTPEDAPDPRPGHPGDDPSSATSPAALGKPLIRQIRRRGVTTALGAATAWLIGTCTPGTARRTSTMALCGLVGAQLTQTLHRRRHSPLILATALGSAAALIALVQTPLLSHFFGCTPLGPVAWSGVAAAVLVTVLAPKVTPAVERLGSHLTSKLSTVTSRT